MRSRSLAGATAACAALAFAGPATADSGNSAFDSTGVVQIGTVNAEPAIDVATPVGAVTTGIPAGSTSGDSGGGGNTSSGSTGVVQSSPFSTHPRAYVSTRTSSITASGPAAVGAGDNRTSSSTGTVQVGGGNSASSSTGTAQLSGVQASPAASATPGGGSSSTAGLSAGVGGSGNTAGNSTGAVQVGGGNASTGSLGSAQSGAPTVAPELGLVTPPGAPNVLRLLSVDGSPGVSGGNTGASPSSASAAGILSSPPVPAPVATAATHPVRTQAANGGARAQAQGTRKRATGVLGGAEALAGHVVTGTLPFTGRNLVLWTLAGLVLLGTGAALRRRGVAVR